MQKTATSDGNVIATQACYMKDLWFANPILLVVCLCFLTTAISGQSHLEVEAWHCERRKLISPYKIRDPIDLLCREQTSHHRTTKITDTRSRSYLR
jgi:hypothetical protein